MNQCSKCGQPIRWALTATSKKMPLDFNPTADGNVRITGTYGGDDTCETLGPLELEIARGDGSVLYTSHFATCPDARYFRRDK